MAEETKDKLTSAEKRAATTIMVVLKPFTKRKQVKLVKVALAALDQLDAEKKTKGG